jgi:hypothetical protein
MVGIGWAAKNGMASVWTPDAHEYVILSCQVSCYVTLAFTAIFPADEDIHEAPIGTSIEAKVCGGAHDHVVL